MLRSMPGAASEAAASDSASPKVSVVLTAHGELRFLEAAVDSILRQDYRALELVMVDDGTGQESLFEGIAARDPRIRLLVNPANLGAAAAANRGIEAARCEIIARMDADDIAEPGRIASLVAALERDPELGLVGSAVTLIDAAGAVRRVQAQPETDVEIRWTILFFNPFFHPSVAFRRRCFEQAGCYRIDQAVSYDHYLWFDMLPLCRAANLAAPLTRYRVHPRSLAQMNRAGWRTRTHAIREALWKRLGLTYDLHDDAAAQDVSDFIEGKAIAPPARAAAYRRILTAFAAFRAAPRPFARGQDTAIARRLAHGIVARMLASPPEGRAARLEVWRRAMRCSPRAALAAALRWR